MELSKMKDTEKLSKVLQLYKKSNEFLKITDKTRELSRKYRQDGIAFFDSMHLALAEENKYDYLFTTDYNLLKFAAKLPLKIKVINPAEWILEENRND
jgi:predicted nucleic acid-binding protein